jgi:small subunit ribosomal protein S20
MANIKSSKRDIRKSSERHVLNQKHKGQMRGGLRRARTAIQAGEQGVEEVVREAMSLIDRAASRGAIHRNAAARRKSRLARRVNASQAASA